MVSFNNITEDLMTYYNITLQGGEGGLISSAFINMRTVSAFSMQFQVRMLASYLLYVLCSPLGSFYVFLLYAI
jgi:hypothetical protein